jgi:hypothetical protein
MYGMYSHLGCYWPLNEEYLCYTPQTQRNLKKKKAQGTMFKYHLEGGIK